jgi:hypothetical protein
MDSTYKKQYILTAKVIFHNKERHLKLYTKKNNFNHE